MLAANPLTHASHGIVQKFLIIKTGKTYDGIRADHGCFEDWMAAGLGVDRDGIDVVSVFDGGLLPPHFSGAQATRYAGIVITGSPAMVTERLPWSEAVARWLAFEIVEKQSAVPVLGICYGHQLLAHALGGCVDWNARGREIGTVDIHLTAAHHDDPLFGDLCADTRAATRAESAAVFPAHVTHLQSVVTLPAGAVLLARSALEPHHAFRVGAHVWGVQFHPEFSDDIMRAYIDLLDERIRSEGLACDAIRAGVRAAPLSNTLLQRFARFALARAANAAQLPSLSSLPPPSLPSAT